MWMMSWVICFDAKLCNFVVLFIATSPLTLRLWITQGKKKNDVKGILTA